jgi:hypothetical protein
MRPRSTSTSISRYDPSAVQRCSVLPCLPCSPAQSCSLPLPFSLPSHALTTSTPYLQVNALNGVVRARGFGVAVLSTPLPGPPDTGKGDGGAVLMFNPKLRLELIGGGGATGAGGGGGPPVNASSFPLWGEVHLAPWPVAGGALTSPLMAQFRGDGAGAYRLGSPAALPGSSCVLRPAAAPNVLDPRGVEAGPFTPVTADLGGGAPVAGGEVCGGGGSAAGEAEGSGDGQPCPSAGGDPMGPRDVTFVSWQVKRRGRGSGRG